MSTTEKPNEKPLEEKPTQKPIEKKPPFAGLVAGRIVHYNPKPPEARHADHAGPWAAMVTHVDRDAAGVPTGKVTLNVNLPRPTAIGDDPVARRSDCEYHVGEEIVLEGGKKEMSYKPGSWHWMFEGQGGWASNPPASVVQANA